MSKTDKTDKTSRRRKVLMAGIDIGGKTLAVAFQGRVGDPKDLTFTNDREGHDKLVSLLTKGGYPARVVMEATSLYGLDLALRLTEAKVQVMVVNPRSARRFGEVYLRAKTDRVDAQMLLEYLQRMDFVAWQPPHADRLTLRMMARRIADLVSQRTAEQNRLHAVQATSSTPSVVIDDIKDAVAQLEARITRMVASAAQLCEGSEELRHPFRAAKSVHGIADRSAIALLGELLLLPSDMTAKQVVAHAGLDPRPRESGGPAMGPRSISKIGNSHLRGSLWLPALVASRFEPTVKAYYDRLVDGGKLKMKALTAVCRRLLQALWMMIKTGTNFDPTRFAPRSPPIPA